MIIQLLAQLKDSDLKAIEQEGLGSGFKFSGASIGEIISALVPYVFVISGFALLLFILFGGYSMMVSRGDPKALASAKGKVTNGIIGFLIVFSAYWIVQAVGYILGLPQFGQIFGSTPAF